jgi:hypothetical protein
LIIAIIDNWETSSRLAEQKHGNFQNELQVKIPENILTVKHHIEQKNLFNNVNKYFLILNLFSL